MAPPRDLDDESDHAWRIVLAVDDDDVADLAEPVAGGVEDRAPRQACDEDPLRAHAFQRSRVGTAEPEAERVAGQEPTRWEDGGMSMNGGRFPQNVGDVGQKVASFPDYEAAQKAVSALIAAEIPARDIAIVGQGLRSIERVTGRLGYATAARSGAINGVLLGLLFSAILVIGTPSVPIQAFVGVIFVGIAIGMLLSIVTYSFVRRRKDFASVMQVVADHYEVTIANDSVQRARQVLGRQATEQERPAVPVTPAPVPAASPIADAGAEPPRYGERVPPVPEPVTEPAARDADEQQPSAPDEGDASEQPKP